jgi:hypothetical protein
MSIASVEIAQQVYAKLEWAEKQILDLNELWNEFREHNYPVESNRDPDTGKYVCRLTDAAPIPSHVNLLAGDAIHNLRSALDHLLYRLVCLGTNSLGPFDKVYFPVGDRPREFKARIRAIKKCLKPPAVERLNEIEAYPGGRGNDIWQMHRLNNFDKHRLLLTVTSQNRSRSSAPERVADIRRKFPGMENVPAHNDYRLFQTGIPPKIDLKAGDILDILDEAEVQPKMYFPIEVAFREPGIFQGNPPVVETIQRVAGTVRVVIQGFDSADLLE